MPLISGLLPNKHIKIRAVFFASTLRTSSTALLAVGQILSPSCRLLFGGRVPKQSCSSPHFKGSPLRSGDRPGPPVEMHLAATF